jgi:carbonic anhydrase
LRHGSDLLEDLIARDGLLVVGAEYSLETGVVEFFDGVPSARKRARSRKAR